MQLHQKTAIPTSSPVSPKPVQTSRLVPPTEDRSAHCGARAQHVRDRCANRDGPILKQKTAMAQPQSSGLKGTEIHARQAVSKSALHSGPNPTTLARRDPTILFDDAHWLVAGQVSGHKSDRFGTPTDHDLALRKAATVERATRNSWPHGIRGRNPLGILNGFGRQWWLPFRHRSRRSSPRPMPRWPLTASKHLLRNAGPAGPATWRHRGRPPRQPMSPAYRRC